MKKPHIGFVVRQHNPWAFWISVPLIVFSLLTVFFLGKTFRYYEIQALQQQAKSLQDQIETLELRNQRLVEVNARLDRTARIQSQATQQVNDSLSELQQRLADLNEELAFYRNVLAPESNQGELNIQSFNLEARPAGIYHFRLVLTKNGKNDQSISGRYNVVVVGQQGSEEQRYSIREMLAGEQSDTFSFRYFQTFEGDFRLPDSFEPVELKIEVFPKAKKYKPFSTNVSWADALLEDE